MFSQKWMVYDRYGQLNFGGFKAPPYCPPLTPTASQLCTTKVLTGTARARNDIRAEPESKRPGQRRVHNSARRVVAAPPGGERARRIGREAGAET